MFILEYVQNLRVIIWKKIGILQTKGITLTECRLLGQMVDMIPIKIVTVYTVTSGTIIIIEVHMINVAAFTVRVIVVMIQAGRSEVNEVHLHWTALVKNVLL